MRAKEFENVQDGRVQGSTFRLCDTLGKLDKNSCYLEK